MATITGRDLSSLGALAVRLAREWFFGDNLMANASPSWKGGPGLMLVKLDHIKMAQIRGIIWQPARNTNLRQYGRNASQALARPARIKDMVG